MPFGGAETISIPLSQESNLSACVSLLASLWSEDPATDTLPPNLEVFFPLLATRP